MTIFIFSTYMSFGFPGSYGTISSQKGNYRRFMGSGLTAFFTCMSLHFPAPILIVSAHGWAIICCEYDKCWKVRLRVNFVTSHFWNHFGAMCWPRNGSKTERWKYWHASLASQHLCIFTSYYSFPMGRNYQDWDRKVKWHASEKVSNTLCRDLINFL